jgi:AcrR family transcriptional regulator
MYYFRMANSAEQGSMGLRERKKQRTRATLIDAAMELCRKQGYDQTTVEQIAASADVSPRTFSRYFPTKGAVILTLIGDYAEEVGAALDLVPPSVGPLEAMRQASVSVLTRVADRRISKLSPERVILMLSVINDSDALRRSTYGFRHAPSYAALAKRMGVPVDHRSVKLVVSVFASIVAIAFGDLVRDADTSQLGPMLLVERLNEAFGLLAHHASDLQDPLKGQPPASADS